MDCGRHRPVRRRSSGRTLGRVARRSHTERIRQQPSHVWQKFPFINGRHEDETYCEWIAVRKEDLCLIPDNIDDVSAAGIPVAYLTAQVALTLAGFRPGKTVLAPAIGGSVGNAVTQLARALGAKHAVSSTTSHAKAEQAKALGFNEVIDTSGEKLTDGLRHITDGYGCRHHHRRDRQ
jgi:NADPH:quinone reductase-like Zn-dependent oxidoreductase